MSIINVKGHKTISRIDNFKVGGLTYACSWGVKPNNTHWVLPIHSSPSMRVLICAKITPQSSGMLFGDETFYINLNGLTIRWINPNGAVEQTVTEGEHVIGFIDGTPALDGNLLSSDTLNVSTSANPCHLGSANNPDPIKLANTYIRKVELYGHSTNTTDAKQSWSYYATYIGNNGYLVEKWSNTVLPIQAGGDAVPLTDAFPGYGISIEDLRQVVSTPHRDLVAIYTQDGGTTIGTALEPEVAVATINGQEVRQEMAFRWIGRSLPDGYSLQEHPTYGTTQGIDGELLYGRKPAWNMWADNVNMGRYIGGSVSGSDIRQARIRFNPTIDKFGNRKPLFEGLYGFHLLDWDGYSPTLYHKPDLKVGALSGQAMPNFTLNFVNGLCASLNEEYHQSATGIPVITYKRIAEVQGDVKFVLGNLVSWHEDMPYGDTDGNRIPIYGGYYGVRIGNSPDDVDNPNDVFKLNGMMIMAGWEAEDVELNSKSSIEIRNKYRDIGVSVEPSFFKLAASTQAEIIEYALNPAYSNNGKITCYADFGLLVTKKSNASGFSNGLPNFSAMVSAHRITGQKNVSVEIKKNLGHNVFVELPNNISLVCDSQGNANVLPMRNVSGSSDFFILPVIVSENEAYVKKQVEATLVLYRDGEQDNQYKITPITGIISTKNSFASNSNTTIRDNWFGEGEHYVYKNGVPVSANINDYINNGTVQFLTWNMTNTDGNLLTYGNYSNYIENVNGAYKFKSNISFKIENVKVVGETPTVEEFTFTVNGVEYTAVKDMTWETWIASNYNTGIFHTDLDEDNGIIYVVGRDTSGNNRDVKYDANTWVESHHIIEPHDYIFAPLVG
ncbi:MAG: hypothetical protein II304_09900 [Bacteroidales bacterium]|nr:hypothetical protein [Bacteroidales bacterium]